MQIKYAFATVYFTLAAYSFHLAVKYCKDEVKCDQFFPKSQLQ